MPDALLGKLNNEDDSNKFRGVLPRLAQLLDEDANIRHACLCIDTAIQVAKLPGEGNFCGYRNIQMLAMGLPLDVTQALPVGLGWNVPSIQTMIESAWDTGYNSHSRIQTGGIRDTRKHIGTLEVQALFESLGVTCDVHGFYGRDAYKELLDFAEQYFCPSNDSNDGEKRVGSKLTKVQLAMKAPIFLQRPGHSLTIVGLERTANSNRHLLTFDPAWMPPSAMRKADGGNALMSHACIPSSFHKQWVLRQYRKPIRYLRRFDAFETVSIRGSEVSDTARKEDSPG